MLQDVWIGSINGTSITWDRIPDTGLQEEEWISEDGGSILEVEDVEQVEGSKRKHKKKRRKKKHHHVPAPRKGHVAIYVETDERHFMVSNGPPRKISGISGLLANLLCLTKILR